MNQQQKVARLKPEGRGTSQRDEAPDAGRSGNRAIPASSVSEAAASQVQVTAPEPPSSAEVSWDELSQFALIGIGFVVAIAAFYFARSILMPVLAATIIGITLSPIQKHAERYRIPPIVTGVALMLLLCGGLWLGIVLAADPLTEWVARAPELGGLLKEKLQLLDRPLAMLRELQNAVSGAAGAAGVAKPIVAVETSPAQIAQQALFIITPALTELVIFFGTLLFLLVGITRMRRQLIVFFSSRDARLAVVRIWNDVEQNLIAYLATVTIINLGLGVVTAGLLYVLGFPNPIAFGILISVLNYVPYIGAAIFVAILFVVGLIALPTLGGAVLAPALFVAIATIEGQLITPAIVGHRLTMSPFLVFLALAFWAWLWGPLGAFLATPFLIVCLVVIGHLFPRQDNGALPG
jgi:predicted PurR-regulated permease PerM